VGRNLAGRIASWTLPKQGELLFDKSFLDILAASAVRIAGNGITDEAAETQIGNVHAEIIPASRLHHDKQKRRDAVLGAMREAAEAPYPQDAFETGYKIQQYIPAKTTATALLSGSPVQYEPEDFGDVPDFMREGTSYDAAARGTFTHTVMQFIDFGKGAGAVEDTIDDLIERNILPEDSKNEIDTDAIESFLSSDTCKRILAAYEVKRELPFVIKVNAGDIYKSIDSDREILVQGIIDLCFIEDDEWVLVDYKTNRLDSANTPEMWLIHYKNQLETYKRALTELTGKRVNEAGIYFLSKKEANAYYKL
jgi:ATP-dependent exoDNAse (exonuclease V) beta subunit